MKKLVHLIVVLWLISSTTHAQTVKLKRLFNQSKPTQSLNVANASQTLQVSLVSGNVSSGLWKFEPVADMPDYFRIINSATGQKLNLTETGTVDTSAPSPNDDDTDIWELLPIKGMNATFKSIVNKDKGQRLHLKNGVLMVSDIKANAPTAVWRIVSVNTPTTTNNNNNNNTVANANSTNKKAINDYVNSLNYDPRILLAVEGDGGTVLQDKQVSSSTQRKTDNNAVIICTTVKNSMTNNFDEVVIMQPTNGVVYPGALIYADKFLVRGQPRPLTNLPLAPVRLTVDLPGIGDKGTFVVKSPNNGNVQIELQRALQYWNENSAYKEGYINAARSSSSVAMSYNSEQIGLSLGVNVKWASGEAAAQFAYNSTSSKSVALMMFKQVFYTVTSEPPANPADAFGNITDAQAKVAFNNDMPPAYIQSVSYGRIIMFRMESSEQQTEADMKASFKYAAGAVDVDANTAAKYKNILRNSTITYALLGGNAEVISDVASAQNFKDLEPLIKGKNSVYSKSNPGVPIAYTVRFLKDHQIAKMGFTTEYTKENCERKSNLFVKLVHSGAYVAKYELTYNDNGEIKKIETGEKTAGWSQTFYFPGDATNITMKGWAMTGLVWDPWGEIYNKRLEAADLNKCYQNTGTTLGRGWDTNCDPGQSSPSANPR